jgi:gamma-glutamyltranspeptidase/glutathione hydrolase
MLRPEEGCVVSYCPIASALGSRVLAEGGNAVDAAVATALGLAVTYPQAGNLGGGGFLLVYQRGECHALDYRERSPAKIRYEHFERSPLPPEERTVLGALPVAVPGTVAGLALALERFGRFGWDRLVSLAIDLAEHGMWLTNRQASYLSLYHQALSRFETTRALFTDRGAPPKPGTLFVQADLGRTLRTLAEEGPRAFYEGSVARLITAEMRRSGGMLDEEDLAAYRARWRSPQAITFAGRLVVTPPLPSAGGFVLRTVLALAESLGLAQSRPHSPERLDLLARLMRVAYAKRRELPGAEEDDRQEAAEPEMPLGALPEGFAALEQAALADPAPFPERSMNTTHFSVLDCDGGAVSNTFSLNTLFGSKLAVGGAGFLLNNTLDDFHLGGANWHDLVQGPSHELAAGRRPLSSMAPTLLLHDGRVEGVLGASGGPRIPTVLAQLVVALVCDGESVDQAVRAPRIHHQQQPRFLYAEKRLPEPLVEALRARGHEVERAMNLGIAAAIHLGAEGELSAALDQRFMLE